MNKLLLILITIFLNSCAVQRAELIPDSPGGKRTRESYVDSDGTTVLIGGLDKSVIDEVVRRYMPQISNCYREGMNAVSKGFSGRVLTRWIISGKGRVSLAGVENSTLGSNHVENCLIAVITRMIFPEPLGGGVVEVSYPFSFAPITRPVYVATKPAPTRPFPEVKCGMASRQVHELIGFPETIAETKTESRTERYGRIWLLYKDGGLFGMVDHANYNDLANPSTTTLDICKTEK